MDRSGGLVKLKGRGETGMKLMTGEGEAIRVGMQ